MRTKLLADYKGAKVQIDGRYLLKLLDDVSGKARKQAPGGAGSRASPLRPLGVQQWRGISWTQQDTYYHVGISLLRIAPGNYVYTLATPSTGHFSTSKTTLIDPTGKRPMAQIEWNRDKKAMESYVINAKGVRGANTPTPLDPKLFYSGGGGEQWEAMSYPEFKDSLVNDPVLSGWEPNTVAYMIRHSLTDTCPLKPPSGEQIEVAQRKIDALTLAMFGAEVIRNPREMTIQLMFLDLMQARAKYGSNADKGYTVSRALTREVNGYKGTYNDTAKGGKLPAMATGTSAEGREKNFLTNSPLNQVERKDVTIIIHWLEHTLLFPYVVDEKWADAKVNVHERNVDQSGFKDITNDDRHPLMQQIQQLFAQRANDSKMMLEVDRSA